MKVDRRTWMKYLAGGAAAIGLDPAALAKETSQRTEPISLNDVPESLVKSTSFPIDKTLLLPNNYLDLVSWTLYDCLEVDAGGAIRPVEDQFSESPWDRRRGLDKTNMCMPRMLPASEQFLVERIFFAHDPDNSMSDILEFSRSRVFQLFIESKIYAERPMILHRNPGKLTDFISKLGFPIGGVPEGVGTISMSPDLGLHISCNWQFYSQFRGNYPLTVRKPFRIYTFFDGVLARGVQ